MTTNEKTNKYEELMSDKDFLAELAETTSVAEAHQCFVENGLDISIDETAQILTALALSQEQSQGTDRELTADELEQTTGGSLLGSALWLLKKVDKIAVAYWGSRENMVKQTLGFWGDVAVGGWNQAVRNNGRH